MSTESPKAGPPLRGAAKQPVLLFCAVVLLAALLVLAARMERTAPVDPTERIGRRMELTELIVQEQQRARQLDQQVETLAARIAEHELAAVADSDELAALQAQVDEVAIHGGQVAVEGSGLTVTLEDSLEEHDRSVDPNNLVIHERDLRAVLNALWAGGAEAISINDSRVLSTSGIRCVGNSLHLNGRLYGPPFVVRAIGEPTELRASLDRDPGVERFALTAQEFDLGFDIAAADELVVPAHSGLFGLQLAEPALRDG